MCVFDWTIANNIWKGKYRLKFYDYTKYLHVLISDTNGIILTDKTEFREGMINNVICWFDFVILNQISIDERDGVRATQTSLANCLLSVHWPAIGYSNLFN